MVTTLLVLLWGTACGAGTHKMHHWCPAVQLACVVPAVQQHVHGLCQQIVPGCAVASACDHIMHHLLVFTHAALLLCLCLLLQTPWHLTHRVMP